MEPVQITKLSITYLITIFLLYLISHIGIGIYKNKLKEQIDKIGKNNDLKLEQRYSITKNIFKFYPMVFVVLVILDLLMRTGI